MNVFEQALRALLGTAEKADLSQKTPDGPFDKAFGAVLRPVSGSDFQAVQVEATERSPGAADLTAEYRDRVEPSGASVVEKAITRVEEEQEFVEALLRNYIARRLDCRPEDVPEYLLG